MVKRELIITSLFSSLLILTSVPAWASCPSGQLCDATANSSSDTNVPFTIQGNSATQSGDLLDQYQYPGGPLVEYTTNKGQKFIDTSGTSLPKCGAGSPAACASLYVNGANSTNNLGTNVGGLAFISNTSYPANVTIAGGSAGFGSGWVTTKAATRYAIYPTNTSTQATLAFSESAYYWNPVYTNTLPPAYQPYYSLGCTAGLTDVNGVPVCSGGKSYMNYSMETFGTPQMSSYFQGAHEFYPFWIVGETGRIIFGQHNDSPFPGSSGPDPETLEGVQIGDHLASGYPTRGALTVEKTIAVGSTMQVNVYTVATLPTCNAVAAGTFSAVSDATAPTYNAPLLGGGTIGIPAYCNGTAWVAH